MNYSLQRRGKKGLFSMVFYYRGKQRWIALGTADEEVAKRRAALIAEKADTGNLVEHRGVTLGEFLDLWLETYARQLSITTYESYEKNVRVHIKPALGHIKMTDLRPIDIQLYYAEKVKTLSPTTVRYQHRILRQALDHAVSWEYVAKNVANAAVPPPKRDYEAQTWTPEEAKKFLEVIRGEYLFPAYATTVLTGMRRGEVLGLEIEHLHLDHGLIFVCQQAVLTNNGVIIKSVKTKKSRRLVPIGPVLVDILREHLEVVRQMREKAIKNGLGWWDERNLVFPNRYGRPQDPSNLSGRHFPQMCKKAGVKRIRFHDLRHTHLTEFLRESGNLKLVQERAGHSSIKVTGDIYVHPEVEMQRDAVRRVEETLVGGVLASR